MEHLHGDTNIIEKTTNSHRYTRQMERCNARFLKLSPASLKYATPNTDEIAIQPKKGRGRPKKTTTMNDGSTLAIAPQTQQPKRGRRRPKKH
uniref:DDA1 domain-containing protein n=1 Tax=Strongyloides papillosus TaxID=174720 RepID=A0A0N5CIQ1_STREA